MGKGMEDGKKHGASDLGHAGPRTQRKPPAKEGTEPSATYGDSGWARFRKELAGPGIRFAERVIADLAAICTIVALAFTGYQIWSGNLQYRNSGPDYSWFEVAGAESLSVSSDGIGAAHSFHGLVVSNTGRTGDTIIGLGRNGGDSATVLCVPDFDGRGELRGKDAVSLGTGLVGLQPGEARLVFYLTTGSGGGDGSGFSPAASDGTSSVSVLTASGRVYKARRIDAPREAVDHYSNLPGWFDALDACETGLADMG